MGGDILEVFEETRFLSGYLEDEKGGDESDEDEVRIFRGGHPVVCA